MHVQVWRIITVTIISMKQILLPVHTFDLLDSVLPMHVNWPTTVFAYIVDAETQHEVHVLSEVWRVVCTLNRIYESGD